MLISQRNVKRKKIAITNRVRQKYRADEQTDGLRSSFGTNKVNFPQIYVWKIEVSHCQFLFFVKSSRKLFLQIFLQIRASSCNTRDKLDQYTTVLSFHDCYVSGRCRVRIWTYLFACEISTNIRGNSFTHEQKLNWPNRILLFNVIGKIRKKSSIVTLLLRLISSPIGFSSLKSFY